VPNPLVQFRKTKRTIVALGICLVITGAVSVHNNILFSRGETVVSNPAVFEQAPAATAQNYSPSQGKRWWDLAEKLLMTMCVVLIVHLFDKVYLMDEVIKNTKEVLGSVVGQHVHLIGASDECGIADIYSNRLSAKDKIMIDIDQAERRIWMLGVGLNVRINVKGLFSKLRDRKNAGLDVRILMLDAFRSTAVFRAFLESSQDQVERILTYYEKLCTQGVSDPQKKNAYFSSTLCNEFESTCRALGQTPELASCVKFYAHTPTCWLVITDNKAYFQPYTFGKGVRQQEGSYESDIHRTATGDDTIGDFLPVFKFQSHKNTSTFKTLEDHFLKLWATSDCSLFHIQARQNDKEGILKRIFDTRREWLRHVYNVLYTDRGRESYDKRPGETVTESSGQKEYRLDQRQICQHPVRISFKFRQNGNREFAGRIVDSSSSGLAILTDGELSELSGPLIGSEVEIKLDVIKDSTEPSGLPNLTNFLSEVLLPENNSFEIKNISLGRSPMRLGLKKVA
jgi:hypothetical protein